MKPIYSVCVVEQTEKAGMLKLETLFSSYSPDEIENIKKILLEFNAGFRREAQGRNSREVVVTHVDAKEAEKWMVPGTSRNGLVAKAVKRGHVFRSATEASGHVGLRHNEIAMMLSRCAATGEKEATVRGVTFAYADDVKK